MEPGRPGALLAKYLVGLAMLLVGLMLMLIGVFNETHGMVLAGGLIAVVGALLVGLKIAMRNKPEP